MVFHERGSARQGCKPEGQDSRTNVQGMEAMAKADRSTAATGASIPRSTSEGRAARMTRRCRQCALLFMFSSLSPVVSLNAQVDGDERVVGVVGMEEKEGRNETRPAQRRS